MFQILLIRAGSSEYDQQGRIQGTLDIPLSEEGRRQVEALVDELNGQPWDTIYASPSQSAFQTAEMVGARRDVKPKTLDALSNLDHGLWQGMCVEDVKKKHPKVYRQWLEQPETVCPPQGETIRAAEGRIQSAVAKLAKKHKNEGIVALVVPEPLNTVIRHVLRQEELGDLWRLHAEEPQWELIEIEPATANAP
jgi:probable phosphoglycerate mutase